MCKRCDWCLDGGLMQAYHDDEWGTPEHDDRKLFEYLMLEAYQCGLSWSLILKRREKLRECFDDFDYEKIALYDDARIENILSTDGMLKNRGKARAAVTNAIAFMDIRREFGSFDKFMWDFCGGKTIVWRSHAGKVIPQNELSEAFAMELKRRGFKYLGAVTLYSHLQACGVINDHDPDCYKYTEINSNYPVIFMD